MRPHVLRRADEHIRNLRVAGQRDFAVGGYETGLIVEQDMRGMLLAAADSMEELQGWIERHLEIQSRSPARLKEKDHE